MTLSEKVLKEIKDKPRIRFPKAVFRLDEKSLINKLSSLNDFEFHISDFTVRIFEEAYEIGYAIAWEEMRAQAVAINMRDEEERAKHNAAVVKAEARYKQENSL